MWMGAICPFLFEARMEKRTGGKEDIIWGKG